MAGRQLRGFQLEDKDNQALCGRSLSPPASEWIWDRLHSPQQENIARDTQEQKGRGRGKRPGKRMSRLGDVAGKNRCGDRRELVAKVDDPTECAHTFPRSDQRWDRPSHGRCGGQPSEGQADPEERGGRSVRVCCTQNSQPETRSSNQNDLTNKNGIATALNEHINQPSTDHQIRNCRKQPGHACIEDRMEQVPHDERRRDSSAATSTADRKCSCKPQNPRLTRKPPVAGVSS